MACSDGGRRAEVDCLIVALQGQASRNDSLYTNGPRLKGVRTTNGCAGAFAQAQYMLCWCFCTGAIALGWQQKVVLTYIGSTLCTDPWTTFPKLGELIYSVGQTCSKQNKTQNTVAIQFQEAQCQEKWPKHNLEQSCGLFVSQLPFTIRLMLPHFPRKLEENKISI